MEDGSYIKAGTVSQSDGPRAPGGNCGERLARQTDTHKQLLSPSGYRRKTTISSESVPRKEQHEKPVETQPRDLWVHRSVLVRGATCRDLCVCVSVYRYYHPSTWGNPKLEMRAG